jgi:hypothetical protein
VTQSSFYSVLEYPSSNLVDGNVESFVHTTYEADPWLQVDLGADVAVSRIVVQNRREQASANRIHLSKISLFTGNSERLFVQQLFSSCTHVFGSCDNSWTYDFSVPSPLNDGSTSVRAAATPADIRALNSSASSGVYWLRPLAHSGEPFRAFVDFDNDGGCWVLVSKWGASGKTLDNIFNANAYDTTGGENSVLDPQFAGYGNYSRLSRAQMNALWGVSSHVARIHLKNDAATDTSGVYFQAKDTNTEGFDFWAAHYDAGRWSDDVISGDIADPGNPLRYRSRFMSKIPNPTWASYTSSLDFNNATNYFAPTAYTAGGIGAWDGPGATVAAPNYGTLKVTRHAGFFGDITTGNQWIATINPSDSRFNASEPRQSLVFLRCDTVTCACLLPA